MKTETVKDQVARFLDAWFAVRQYIQASNFNRFQGTGLSATQFMTLNLLPADGSGIAIGELARCLNLKPATVARTVDSLELRKMIVRMRSAPDKRMVMVKITQAGMELQNSANSQFSRQIQKLFQAMSPEERAGLNAGLESLMRAAGRAAALDGKATRRGADAAAPASRSSRRSPQR